LAPNLGAPLPLLLGMKAAEIPGKRVPLWLWMLLMLPPLLGAGGYWFLYAAAAGRQLRVDYLYRDMYRRLPDCERLPVSTTAQRLDPHPGYLEIHIRSDGRWWLWLEHYHPDLPADLEMVTGTKVKEALKVHAIRRWDADRRSTLMVCIWADRRAKAGSVLGLMEAARRERISRFDLKVLPNRPPSPEYRAWPDCIRMFFPPETDDVPLPALSPEATVQDLVDALDAERRTGRAGGLDRFAPP